MPSLSTENASGSKIFPYVAPFVAFMVLLAVVPLAASLIPDTAPIWLARPVYWIFPLQTILCGILLILGWRKIEFRGIAYPSIVFALGFFVFAIWTAPQFFHWLPPRFDPDGFNPDLFAASPAGYWTTVCFRFLRLVVVVPLLEEIFWRGFLMRYLIKEDFASVPFGTWQPRAFFITALAFALAHWGNSAMPNQDFYAALVTGMIYNAVACVTKSLGACVLAHSVTNLFLGLYVMNTKQWGYW